MYHYVRNLKGSKYENLKALELYNFKRQIQFLKKNYSFFDPAQNIKKLINKNLCWLTFDDGYIDHYKNVLPILEENNIKGSFFITSNIKNKKILEVNKIQFILERKKSDYLLKCIKELFKSKFKLKNNDKIDKIISKITLDHRYDDKKTIIVKRLLQRELDEKIRKEIINSLFSKFVSTNEKKFHKELYLNVNQLKQMKKLGHEIGNHAQNHVWLSRLSASKQKYEIIENLKFLKNHNLVNNYWTMCYPYGDFNKNTLKIVKNLNCTRALTTIVKNASKKDNIFKLPRLNTNDFFPIKK